MFFEFLPSVLPTASYVLVSKLNGSFPSVELAVELVCLLEGEAYVFDLGEGFSFLLGD